MKQLVFLLITVLVTTAATAQTRADYDATAQKFMQYYNANQPEKLYNIFAQRIKNMMSLNDTKGMFYKMSSEQGKLKSATYIKQDERFTFYKLQYEKSAMAMAITLNIDKTLQSFRVMAYKEGDDDKLK